MRLEISSMLFGPNSAMPNTAAIRPVTKASGRPSSSITIMLPNIRIVIHSMLTCGHSWAVPPPGASQIDNRLQDHQHDAGRQRRLEDHGDRHVPGAAAGLAELDRDQGLAAGGPTEGSHEDDDRQRIEQVATAPPQRRHAVVEGR